MIKVPRNSGGLFIYTLFTLAGTIRSGNYCKTFKHPEGNLKKTITLGFKDVKEAEAEPVFDKIKSYSQFREVIAKIQQ